MKFRKKPVEIEARQWDGTAKDAAEIINWADNGGSLVTFYCADKKACQDNRHVLKVSTLEGVMTAAPGDWIICGVHGEFYPCKPDIFALTYDPVDGEISGDDLHL